jgi:hypothetical protein
LNVSKLFGGTSEDKNTKAFLNLSWNTHLQKQYIILFKYI